MPESKSIQSMALGDQHLLILISKKEVIGLGDNSYG